MRRPAAAAAAKAPRPAAPSAHDDAALLAELGARWGNDDEEAALLRQLQGMLRKGGTASARARFWVP
jgi:hypothetical protein